MADTNWFEVVDGTFALALVDRQAPGYSSAWQAPSGLTVDQVTVDSYDMPGGTSWQCQLTKGILTPKSETSTRSRPATWCNRATSTATPTESSWTLDVDWAQDPHLAQGLTRFMFENDAREAYFLLGLAAAGPPVAIGRLYLSAGAIGGEPDKDLIASVSMQLSRKPSLELGDSLASEVVN